MINTAPPTSNSVYGREKLFWYDKIDFSNHVCHCGAVVKEFPGAPNENIVQNLLNIALLNVF